MSDGARDYTPISCEFHDHLEALATVRRPARICYVAEDGTPQERDAAVADVYSRGGAEYLVLASGETVRLDRLVEVDGRKLADY